MVSFDRKFTNKSGSTLSNGSWIQKMKNNFTKSVNYVENIEENVGNFREKEVSKENVLKIFFF